MQLGWVKCSIYIEVGSPEKQEKASQDTTDSLVHHCTTVSGDVFTPGDVRARQELYLEFDTCICINIEPFVLHTVS